VCIFLSSIPRLLTFSRFDLWEGNNTPLPSSLQPYNTEPREGSALATRIGQTAQLEHTDSQAANILCFLQVRGVPLTFPIKSYLSTRLTGTNNGFISPPTLVVVDPARTQTPFLASIHTWDINAGCDANHLPSRAPTRHFQLEGLC